MSATPRRGRLAPVMLAGWLFADLLLMLALVSMSGQPDPQADDVSASPSSSASPSESRSPSPSPSPSKTQSGPRSVGRIPVKFRVSGGNDASLVRQLSRATRQWAGREAAIVLTFGGSRSGTSYADTVNGLLHRARPEMFPRGIITHDFLDLSSAAQTAELWVYFYTTPT